MQTNGLKRFLLSLSTAQTVAALFMPAGARPLYRFVKSGCNMRLLNTVKACMLNMELCSAAYIVAEELDFVP